MLSQYSLKTKERTANKKIVHLADSIKHEFISNNKICRNLKMKRFKMPNAPYSNRWHT
jgi:hypothetical protein